MHETDILHEGKFWVTVAVIIFFILFGKKLWQVLVGMLDKRTEAVQLELDEASRLRREAEAMLTEAQTARDAALRDARALLESAKAEAARVAEQAAADAATAAERRQRMALDRIAAAEQAAVRDVRNAAAEVAVQAARDILRGGAAAEHDVALIDHAISGLPRALSGRRAA